MYANLILIMALIASFLLRELLAASIGAEQLRLLRTSTVDLVLSRELQESRCTMNPPFARSYNLKLWVQLITGPQLSCLVVNYSPYKIQPTHCTIELGLPHYRSIGHNTQSKFELSLCRNLQQHYSILPSRTFYLLSRPEHLLTDCFQLCMTQSQDSPASSSSDESDLGGEGTSLIADVRSLFNTPRALAQSFFGTETLGNSCL